MGAGPADWQYADEMVSALPSPGYLSYQSFQNAQRQRWSRTEAMAALTSAMHSIEHCKAKEPSGQLAEKEGGGAAGGVRVVGEAERRCRVEKLKAAEVARQELKTHVREVEVVVK